MYENVKKMDIKNLIKPGLKIGGRKRVKTDQGHQELTVKRPMCDYATEFRKVAI